MRDYFDDGSTYDWGSPGADILDRLLAPFDPCEFVEDYWGRRPLYVKGHPGKFDGLFSTEQFHKALRRAVNRAHIPSFRLSAIVQDFDGSWSTTEPVELEEVDARFAEGYTVCVNDITIGDEALSAVCEAVKRRMNFTGSVRFNCYRSPDGSGADTHLDKTISTTLQIEGSKRWRFARKPAVAWPPSNARILKDGSRQWTLPWIGNEPWEQLDPMAAEDFDEVLLEPGDLLCIPAGTWHSASATGSSLALNMAFSPASGISIITRFLEVAFEASEAWRGGPPPTYHGAASEVPPSVRDYLDTRLREACSKLESHDACDEVVQGIWRSFVEGDN